MCIILALFVLIMPEEFNTHPGPKVEEHINWYGNWQEETVKAQAGCASAALWKFPPQKLSKTVLLKRPME